MNWQLLEEKYPNAYPEIVEFDKTYEVGKSYRRFMLNEYCKSKGYKAYPMFIYALRKIEVELKEKN